MSLRTLAATSSCRSRGASTREGSRPSAADATGRRGSRSRGRRAVRDCLGRARSGDILTAEPFVCALPTACVILPHEWGEPKRDQELCYP
jgi:hypothetical protein